MERGQPNVVIDSIGWVWGIPEKIMLWDRRVSNPVVSGLWQANVFEMQQTEKLIQLGDFFVQMLGGVYHTCRIAMVGGRSSEIAATEFEQSLKSV